MEAAEKVIDIKKQYGSLLLSKDSPHHSYMIQLSTRLGSKERNWMTEMYNVGVPRARKNKKHLQLSHIDNTNDRSTYYIELAKICKAEKNASKASNFQQVIARAIKEKAPTLRIQNPFWTLLFWLYVLVRQTVSLELQFSWLMVMLQ